MEMLESIIENQTIVLSVLIALLLLLLSIAYFSFDGCIKINQLKKPYIYYMKNNSGKMTKFFKTLRKDTRKKILNNVRIEQEALKTTDSHSILNYILGIIIVAIPFIEPYVKRIYNNFIKKNIIEKEIFKFDIKYLKSIGIERINNNGIIATLSELENQYDKSYNIKMVIINNFVLILLAVIIIVASMTLYCNLKRKSMINFYAEFIYYVDKHKN